MIITFLVRSRAFDVGYHRFYSSIEGAFNLAYILNENPKVLEFKCLFDEVILDEIPASSYKPSKLVKKFDYTKE
jgi:hypothetical protein